MGGAPSCRYLTCCVVFSESAWHAASDGLTVGRGVCSHLVQAAPYTLSSLPTLLPLLLAPFLGPRASCRRRTCHASHPSTAGAAPLARKPVVPPRPARARSLPSAAVSSSSSSFLLPSFPPSPPPPLRLLRLFFSLLSSLSLGVFAPIRNLGDHRQPHTRAGGTSIGNGGTRW